MLFPLIKVKIKVHMSELKYIGDSRLQGNPIKQHAYWVAGMVMWPPKAQKQFFFH